jgi:hypothetical protein
MKSCISNPVKRKVSLQEAICGRDLTGLYLEEETNELHLRFIDSTLTIHLGTRDIEFRKRDIASSMWLSFPGWLRVTRVIEDGHQISLVVSGAIYTMRIVVRESHQHWHILFQGGRLLASA